MTVSPEYVDRIVQSVLRELQSRTVSASGAAPSGPGTGPSGSASGGQTAAGSSAPQTSLPLALAGAVISEEILTAANAGGRTIVLQPGAVLTPSGRDFIRRHNVRIGRSGTGNPGVATTGTLIVIGQDAAGHTVASAAGWKPAAAATEIEAARQAAQVMTAGPVVCRGGEPSIVACLLNRDPAVRAAVVTRTTNLMTLTSVMHPQVICVESAGWSFGELLKLLRSLRMPAARPSSWNELPSGGVR